MICAFIKEEVNDLDHDVNELLSGGRLEVLELLSPLVLPLTELRAVESTLSNDGNGWANPRQGWNGELNFSDA